MLMINDDDDETSLLLHKSDYPSYYINYSHPTDYINSTIPISELIFHKKKNHNRLLFRISIKLDNNIFLPITLVSDTGAPSYLYLCEKTKNLIKNRIKIDEFETEYLILLSSPSQKEGKGDGNKKIPINDTPVNHPNINIIGLRFLQYLQLYLTEEGFDFRNKIEYI